MTPDEQQQVNAMMRFYEAQVGNLTTAGAQTAIVAESLAIQLKAAREEIAALKMKLPPEPKMDSNVVPISDAPTPESAA